MNALQYCKMQIDISVKYYQTNTGQVQNSYYRRLKKSEMVGLMYRFRVSFLKNFVPIYVFLRKNLNRDKIFQKNLP